MTIVGQNGFDKSDSGGMRWIGVFFFFFNERGNIIEWLNSWTLKPNS